jgi:putative chitinase
MDLSKLGIPEKVKDEIPNVRERYEINTPLRLAQFLAQCAHESGGFKHTVENLNYSAKGLRAVFSKYFTTEQAERYARKPELIAARVYADRIGNGNEMSGDGWRYRGRGYIQLTGRNNYLTFNHIVDDDVMESPDLVSAKYPLLSAAWYWNSRSLNKLADNGAEIETVKAITKKVNGGYHGLDSRVDYFKNYLGELV